MKKETSVGQFSTPAAVAEFVVANTEVRKDAKIIDPAVGDGSFLAVLASRGYRKVWGVELDEKLASLVRERVEGAHLFVGDALDPALLGNWANASFDVAIGNPPFSNQRAKVDDPEILKHYELGKVRQSVEILFLERFIQLVKPSGLVRIILPINIFSNTNLRFVREFILKNLWIEAVVSLPRRTFEGTSAKTAVLFGQRKVASWDLRGSFWRKRGIRLIQVSKRRELKDLPSLSIYARDAGIEVPEDRLVDRMDPEYHTAEAQLERMVSGSGVPFAPLSALAQARTGFARYGEHRKQLESSVPDGESDKYVRLIRARNLDVLGFNLQRDPCFIRKDGKMFRSWACVDVGDVLVVRVGEGCVGRAAWIADERYLGQADDWMFILKATKLDPAYLTFYLNSSLGRAFILKEAQGTATLSISKGKLMNVRVPVPPMSEQEAFRPEVMRMYEAFAQGRREEAEAIFQSLEERLQLLLSADSAGGDEP